MQRRRHVAPKSARIGPWRAQRTRATAAAPPGARSRCAAGVERVDPALIDCSCVNVCGRRRAAGRRSRARRCRRRSHGPVGRHAPKTPSARAASAAWAGFGAGRVRVAVAATRRRAAEAWKRVERGRRGCASAGRGAAGALRGRARRARCRSRARRGARPARRATARASERPDALAVRPRRTGAATREGAAGMSPRAREGHRRARRAGRRPGHAEARGRARAAPRRRRRAAHGPRSRSPPRAAPRSEAGGACRWRRARGGSSARVRGGAPACVDPTRRGAPRGSRLDAGSRRRTPRAPRRLRSRRLRRVGADGRDRRARPTFATMRRALAAESPTPACGSRTGRAFDASPGERRCTGTRRRGRARVGRGAVSARWQTSRRVARQNCERAVGSVGSRACGLRSAAALAGGRVGEGAASGAAVVLRPSRRPRSGREPEADHACTRQMRRASAPAASRDAERPCRSFRRATIGAISPPRRARASRVLAAACGDRVGAAAHARQAERARLARRAICVARRSPRFIGAAAPPLAASGRAPCV